MDYALKERIGKPELFTGNEGFDKNKIRDYVPVPKNAKNPVFIPLLLPIFLGNFIETR